jgi:hypothetical protein
VPVKLGHDFIDLQHVRTVAQIVCTDKQAVVVTFRLVGSGRIGSGPWFVPSSVAVTVCPSPLPTCCATVRLRHCLHVPVPPPVLVPRTIESSQELCAS